MRYQFLLIIMLLFVNLCGCLICYSAEAQDSSSTDIHRVKDNTTCLYGYKNSKGKWVLKPQFLFAKNFVGKYAIVNKHEQYGVIDKEGKYILDPIYDELFHVRKEEVDFYSTNDEVREEEMGIEGLYIFLKDNKYGIIRADGSIIVPAAYSKINPNFKEGVGQIWNDTLVGFADTLGYIIKPQYNYAFSFENGIAKVSESSKAGVKTGYINKKGDYVLPLDYYEFIREDENRKLFIYKQNGKLGLFKKDGIVLKSEFDYVDLSDTSFILVKQNRKYGIVNSDGKYVIPLKHDSLRIWTNNKIFFYKKGYYGILNKTNGRLIKKSIYSDINTNLHHEFAIVKANGKFGLIDTAATVLLEPVYDSIVYSRYYGSSVKLYLFKNGFLKIYSFEERSIIPFSTSPIHFFGDWENQTGIVNQDGRIILPPKYTIETTDSSVLFHNSSGYGLMDMKGEMLVTPGTYEWILHYGYSYLVKGKNKKLGLIDKEGKVLVEILFYAIYPYDYKLGCTWVSRDSVVNNPGQYGCCSGNFGLIKKGKDFIITPQFTNVGQFSKDKIAIVSKGDKYGLINAAGVVILPFEYEYIEQVDNGLFYIYKDEKVGLANKEGKVVAEPLFDKINAFNGSYAKVILNEKVGLIDESGQMTVPLIDNLADTDVSLADLPFPDYEDHSHLKPNLHRYTSKYHSCDFELLDSFPDKHIQILINNHVLAKIPNKENIDEESPSESRCNFNLMTVNGPCAIEQLEGSLDRITYSYSIASYGRKYFSIIEEEAYSYGYTDYSYVFYNYRIENKKAVPIQLDYFFTLGYRDKLNAMLLEEIRKRDDIELDCNNPEALLELIQDNFTVSDEGIFFYFDIPSREDYEKSFNYAEVYLPFTSLTGILRRDLK